MPKPTVRVPSLVHHKPSGRARVRIAGRDIWLGKWGAPEADERYRRVVAEYLSTGATPSPSRPAGTSDPGVSIAELILSYADHCESWYRKGGSPTTELGIVKDSLRRVRLLYGDTPAAEFTPMKLEAVRDEMVRQGLVRTSINLRIGRIKRAFKWGVARGLVPAQVLVGLNALDGLRRGRSAAKESEPVKPVSEASVNATLPFLTPQVRDIVRLQMLSGCRPGEICLLRPCDVDRSGEVWAFTPIDHKTSHHGHERRIHFGPRAQVILSPWLENRPADAWCFSPREAQAAWRDANYKKRGSRRKRGGPRTHQARELYDNRSYGNAVKRACVAAKIEHWTPNQLRHAAATTIRREFGLERAQVALGHAAADVTQVYAERDMELARRVAAAIG